MINSYLSPCFWGIYAGKGRTRQKILKEYPLINEILLERYRNKNRFLFYGSNSTNFIKRIL